MTNSNQSILIAALQNIRGIPAGPDAFNKVQKIACEALAGLSTATQEPDAGRDGLIVRLQHVVDHLADFREGFWLDFQPVRDALDALLRYRAATSTPHVAVDPQLARFYQVGSVPALLAAMAEHIEKLQDSARRNVKPWEDTFPPTLLPKYLRDAGYEADPAHNERYRVSQQGFWWWIVRAGDGTRTVFRSQTKDKALDVAAKLLTEFRTGEWCGWHRAIEEVSRNPALAATSTQQGDLIGYCFRDMSGAWHFCAGSNPLALPTFAQNGFTPVYAIAPAEGVDAGELPGMWESADLIGGETDRTQQGAGGIRCHVSEEGVLRIETTVQALLFAAREGDYFFAAKEGGNALVICDEREFVADVVSELTCESEDGSTPITRAFDKAIADAVEHGSMGIDEASLADAQGEREGNV